MKADQSEKEKIKMNFIGTMRTRLFLLLATATFSGVFDTVWAIDNRKLAELKGFSIVGNFTVEKIIKEDAAYGTKHKLVLSDFTQKLVFTSDDFLFSYALIGVLPGITEAVLLAKPGTLKVKNGKSVSYYELRAIIENEILTFEPIFGE